MSAPAAAVRTNHLTLHEGIYAGVIGPQYETPAEVKMLSSLGADAVGMSTVCETIQARALGLEVARFSGLTNWAAGLNRTPRSHAEVLAAGETIGAEFISLLGRRSLADPQHPSTPRNRPAPLNREADGRAVRDLSSSRCWAG